MILNAIIDETVNLTGHEARLASILEFVADETTRGIFYLFKDWTFRLILEQPTTTYKPEQPRLVYLSKDEWEANDNKLETPDGPLPIHIPSSELILSNSPVIRRAALEQQGLNATTALLILAAAGIDIALPNASFNRESREEIESIKIKLGEERRQYLEAISSLADQSFERLSSGDLKDVYIWARNESVLKILPKAQLLHSKLEKLDRPLLERAGVLFWREGVPAIGKALFEKGGRAAIKSLAEEIIRSLASTLSKSIEERRIPEACYALKLSKELL